MIVVFAGEHDQYARELTRRWADRGALLMTPRDLSRAGWKCNLNDPDHSMCVIGGVVYDADRIDGILVRSTMILESDLSHIASSDRAYVAAEINAFMIYWLATLGRLVMNPPTPRSLSGPGWYPEHWLRCAYSVGLRVKPLRRLVSVPHIIPLGWPQYDGPLTELIVVGERCFGTSDPALKVKACSLAKASRVNLISLRFDGSSADSCFLEADLFPSLDDEIVENAVLSHLELGRSNSTL